MDFLPRQRLRLRALPALLSGDHPRFLRPPRLVQVEVTRRCDLACRTCTRGKLPAREDLGYDDFIRILEQLGEIDLLWLSGQGEPLLHPELPRMVRACADRGLRGTILHTNGMQLRGRILDELAGAGLGEMKLSIDGGVAADVEYLRDGADLERILDHAAEFARRSPTPVTIYTVLNRRTAASLPRLADLAARAGARRIEAVETVPFRDGSTEREVYDRREYQFATLPRAEQARLAGELRRAARANGITVRVDLRWERTRCREPMTKLYVDVEGNVTPCCRIHHEVLAGNLLREGFDAVWRGPVLSRWRVALRRRELQPRICVERCHLGLRLPR